MPSMQKIIVVGGIALLAFAVVALVQQKVTPIPLVGGILPR